MSYRFLDEVTEESAPESVARNTARTGSNVTSLGLGFAGDMFSLINEYIAKPVTEAVTGTKGLPYEETTLGKVLPTSSFHKKSFESVGGDYLKPKNEIEKFLDGAIENTALLYSPGSITTRGGKVLTGAQKQFRNFTKGVGAELFGKAAEDISGDPSSGKWARIGSLFALSIMDKQGAAKQIASLYKNAENAIPEGATTSSRSLENSMDSLIHKITKGRPSSNLSTSQKFVVDQAENVLKLTKNGQIPVDQAWAQLRTINEELSTILPNLPWQQRKGVRTMALEINSSLNKTLESYGKSNTAFAKNFHPAQEAFSAMAQSNFVGNWVQRNIKHPILSEGLVLLLGSSAVSAASKAAVPYKAAQLMYRINKSPALTKMYGETLKSAANENIKQFNYNLQKLDEAIQLEESKPEYRFID